jgi:hypothetical protein
MWIGTVKKAHSLEYIINGLRELDRGNPTR